MDYVLLLANVLVVSSLWFIARQQRVGFLFGFIGSTIWCLHGYNIGEDQLVLLNLIIMYIHGNAFTDQNLWCTNEDYMDSP